MKQNPWKLEIDHSSVGIFNSRIDAVNGIAGYMTGGPPVRPCLTTVYFVLSIEYSCCLWPMA